MRSHIFSTLLFVFYFGFILRSQEDTIRKPKFDKTEEIPLEELVEMSLEDLMKVKIVSASRDTNNLANAPAVITIITAQQIREQGYKTLKEALDRVVGYFSVPEWSSYIGNRGIVKNSLSFLITIDGKSINNKSVRGVADVHMFPNLDMVKQIEIIRNPSSTIWGSDACLGMINIITYSTRELIANSTDNSFTRVNYDYELVNQRQIFNVTTGKLLENGLETFLALNYAESNGKILDRYMAGPNGPDLTSNVYSFQPMGNSYQTFFPSYEALLKLNYKDLSFATRIFDFDNSYAGNAGMYGDVYHAKFHRQYVTAAYKPQLSKTWRLEAVSTFDRENSTQYWPNPSRRTSAYYEFLEDVMVIKKDKNNTFRAGLQYTFSHFDAVREIGQAGAPFGNVPQTPKGNENVFGIFIEDTYTFFNKLNLTAGLRYCYADFRGKINNVYPRLAVVYSPIKTFTLKYIYNTGVTQPLLEDMWGSFNNRVKAAWDPNLNVIGATKPQSSESHEFNLSFRSKKIWTSVTLYQMSLFDFLSWVGYATEIDGENFLFAAQNTGTVTTRGIEVEAHAEVNKFLDFYGNFSYSNTKLKDRYVYVPEADFTFDLLTAGATMSYTDDLDVVNTPNVMYNLGMNCRLNKKIVLNLHYRGWAEMYTRLYSNSNEYTSFGPQGFVDANLCLNNIFKNALSIYIYARNIGKGNYRLPVFGNGYIIDHGARYGIKLSLNL